MTRVLVLASLLLFCPSCGESTQPETPEGLASPFNQRRLIDEGSPAFSFLCCGNLIGDPKGQVEPPVATLAEHLPALVKPEDRFFMMLGDCFFRADERERRSLGRFLEQTRALPTFNAAGNHDLADRADYEQRYGKTYFSFSHRRCRFIVLDTEADPWNISGPQLAFLEAELDALERDPARALFLFGHKPVWAGTRETVIASLAGNAPSTLGVFAKRPKDAALFNRDLRPRLRRLAARTPVWCLAGDVGARAGTTLHLFQEKDRKAPHLRYLAVGLGNLDRDAVLRIEIPETGPPQARAIELKTGRELDLEDHGSERWMKTFFPDGLPDAALPFLED